MSCDHLYYLGLKAIIQNPSKLVLLLKNVRGYWDFPGGRIQSGETPIEALLREVKEETGLTQLTHIQPDTMVLTAFKISLEKESSAGLILWYHTCVLEQDHPIYLSLEHREAIWVPPFQVRKLTAVDHTVAPHLFEV